MSLLHLVILSILQGITEFLPVSSSGHLAVLPLFMDWQDQGLLIDVSVHVGTLLAVMIYFRRDLCQIVNGGLGAVGLSEKSNKQNQNLFWFLVLGSIPVLVAGALLALSGYSEFFRNPLIIGLASIGFGLLLFAGDKWGAQEKGINDLTAKSALTIGLYQILALIPGTSRAGITMTGARFLGLNRVDAARFSMLLSIPVILAAGGWSTLELLSTGLDAEIFSAVTAAGLSFLTALAAIHFLLKWLARSTMTIFVVYRVALGVVILAMLV